MEEKKKIKARIILVCSIIAITIFLFILQYQYDNKYTYQDNNGSKGVIDLTDYSNGYQILTYGWELYSQEFIKPGDFEGRDPLYTYIGEYSGFESEGNSPHGCATYRLVIKLPETSREYYLELPEIYTASKVYINGLLMDSNGVVESDGGEPGIQNSVISFQASGQVEIVIWASDDSHYYSGFVYPPAFGDSSVMDLVYFRFFRSIVLTSLSIIFCLFFGSIGIRLRKLNYFLFSGFCLCFAGFVSYPVIHQFVTDLWTYRFEDFFFYLMLLFLILLQSCLCEVSPKIEKPLFIIGALFSICTVFIPTYLLGDSLNAMYIYSDCIDIFKYFLIGYMLVSTIISVLQKKLAAFPLLVGNCIFAVTLLCQGGFVVFEPIRFGWPVENAAFIILMILVVLSWRETLQTYHYMELLSIQKQTIDFQLRLEKQNYQLMTESEETVRRMNHDLRHHIRTLQSLADNKEFDELTNYIHSMQEHSFATDNRHLCINPIINSILLYYDTKARESDITFNFKVELPMDMTVDKWDLSILFGNLLENAFQAVEGMSDGHRNIVLKSVIKNRRIVFSLTNEFDGNYTMQNGQYLTTKNGGHGIGLTSVTQTLEKYDGNIDITTSQHNFEVKWVIPLF